MAQSVEQLIRNQQVGGSSPPTSSIKKNACDTGVLFLCPFSRGFSLSARTDEADDSRNEKTQDGIPRNERQM